MGRAKLQDSDSSPSYLIGRVMWGTWAAAEEDCKRWTSNIINVAAPLSLLSFLNFVVKMRPTGANVELL